MESMDDSQIRVTPGKFRSRLRICKSISLVMLLTVGKLSLERSITDLTFTILPGCLDDKDVSGKWRGGNDESIRLSGSEGLRTCASAETTPTQS